MDQPVLMIYALSPAYQARRKSLFGAAHYADAVKLFQDLHQKTESLTQNSGLKTFWFFDHLQEGKSFGERYANAFKEVFSKGYQKVISIGNDIPELELSHIEQASNSLTHSKAVLGPAADGGDYLIALTEETFYEEEFKNLPWNKSSLHSKLSELLSSYTSVEQLECLVDIDDFQSLVIVRKNVNWIAILLFSLKSFILYTKTVFEKLLLPKDNPLRAPPLSI